MKHYFPGASTLTCRALDNVAPEEGDWSGTSRRGRLMMARRGVIVSFLSICATLAAFVAAAPVQAARPGSDTAPVPIPGGIDVPPLIHVFAPTWTATIVKAWWWKAGLIALAAALIGAVYPGFKAAKQDAIEALAYD